MREGIECFVKLGELLGKDNLFYIGAMEGVDRNGQIPWRPYTKEAMIAEATVQSIQNGAFVDISDIRKNFKYDHCKYTVLKYANNYGMKY